MLAELGKFGVAQKLSLRDPTVKAAFSAHVSAAVDQALGDPILLHGQRTEAMFEALLVSLGEFRLLKAEDSGPVFPSGRFRVPDFRVVLKTGEQWLIEVKNVYIQDPAEQRREIMDADYLRGLEDYAATVGGELKLAVYWARWGLWTLVSPRRFAAGDGSVVLEMNTALCASELGLLGDRTIGTVPSLRLRFVMDRTRTKPIAADGQVECVIGGFQVFAADAEITDALEREIFWIFIEHGEWPGK